MTHLPAEALAITGAAILEAKSDPALGPRRIEKLDPPAGLSALAVRKLSRLGRMGLIVADAALKAADLMPGPELGLVVGTGLADLEETADFLGGVFTRGEEFASPQHFQRSMHSTVAGELAILYGLRGYNSTITQGLASGESALLAAALAVSSGRCQRCLCVAVDALSEGLVLGWSALGARGAPGEGAAAVVVEKCGDREVSVLAQITLGQLLEIVDRQREVHKTDDVRLEIHGALGLMKLASGWMQNRSPTPAFKERDRT